MKKVFKLDGLDCANCAAKMERSIAKLDGVIEVNVNFMTTKLVINAADDKIENIVASAREIIRKLEPQVVMK